MRSYKISLPTLSQHLCLLDLSCCKYWVFINISFKRWSARLSRLYKTVTCFLIQQLALRLCIETFIKTVSLFNLFGKKFFLVCWVIYLKKSMFLICKQTLAHINTHAYKYIHTYVHIFYFYCLIRLYKALDRWIDKISNSQILAKNRYIITIVLPTCGLSHLSIPVRHKRVLIPSSS